MSRTRESSSDSEDERKRTLEGERMERKLSAPQPLSPNAGSIAAVVKERKMSLNMPQRQSKQPNFGICFDIDGVLARGSNPIPAAQEGFRKLIEETTGQFKYPVAFVTNALNLNQDKADAIASWFGIPISKEQMIQSPGPLECFKQFHEKRCMCVGQGKMVQIANELGFQNLCTVDDVAAQRPLLDVVNHDNRKKIDSNFVNKEFAPIEAILLLGEPKYWESSLQIVIDLLLTNGCPDKEANVNTDTHIPVIACNMDLRFMERCHMPRFGHGAFLVCLEALYKKITGGSLHYSALTGKPSEITYRFAEHVLAREALKLGFTEPLKTMYLIGDNPMSDIVGSNLYQRYIDRMKHRRRRISIAAQQQFEPRGDPDLPNSRNIPPGAVFLPQSVDTMESILVCTGVYKKGCDPEGDGKYYHGHRDFPKNTELNVPTFICEDADEAIDYILLNEDIISN